MDQATIEIVKNHLSDGPVSVTFTKSDGSERIMLCTTCLEDIPTDKHPKEDTKRNYSDEVQRVFDLEKQEWRSFRWDSVTEVSLGD